ncbi:MAG TPA: hypothetical protein VFP21_08115 [Solirubrobacterales bacterium]|nr:hypothetical protein [Solirubrobacterales bacterium]
MKYLKMLGLAAVAAMALTAVAGAGSASAHAVLCKESAIPCGSSYKTGEHITATAGTTRFTAGLEVTCTSSEATIQVTGAGGEGKMTGLTFGGCKSSLGGCTVTAEGLPYSGEADVSGTGPNGTLTLAGAQAGVKCEGLTCTYAVTSLSLPIDGGSTALVTANGVELKKTGGGFLCPSTVKWDATYSTSNVWVRVQCVPQVKGTYTDLEECEKLFNAEPGKGSWDPVA